MPTTVINSYTTPESTKSPVIHEDLAAMAKQMAMGDVMYFLTASERTAKFTTLGTNPPVGAVSHLADTGRYFKWGGSSWDLLPAVAGGGMNGATGAGTTTSATYVDFPATSAFSFTKLGTGTVLRVAVNVTLYSTSTGTEVRLAVAIGGTDYDIAGMQFNEANSHRQVSGVRRISSLAANAYTVQLRWRRVTGAGTLTSDAFDWISMDALEVQ